MGDASVGVRGEGSPSGGGTIFDELEQVGGLFTTEDIRAGKQLEISRGAMKAWLESINPAYGAKAKAMVDNYEFTGRPANTSQQVSGGMKHAARLTCAI